MFTSLLIANRGEIAVRIMRTARAMGLRTVAVYSDPDADALHIAAADDAVALRGSAAADTYLNIDKLLAAAATTGAEAVHPGYGFLAENPAFAQACLDAGLIWVGPAPAVIAAMGDKIEAKTVMRTADVPVLPDAVVSEQTDLDAAGRAVGFPLLVKATGGGGGKGMRLVTAPEDLEAAVAAARREAAGAFGDDRVFLERFVSAPRHIEVQILGDALGNLVHLGERECSVQRRHQKIIEESPSPAVDAVLRERMTGAALRGAKALGYTNAGTVEFVLGSDGEFAFLEVNTRLQVEHPVTELAWGLRDGGTLDLVRLQLLVAAGTPLPFTQDDLVPAGHAVEARVYAEDVGAGFLPSTGTLRTWDVPSRPGIRVDAGVRNGTTVSVHYDPMLAKVIAVAPTRTEAVSLLGSALRNSRIHGVVTNRDFLVAALRDAEFVAGTYDTSLVDRRLLAADLPASSADHHHWHAVAAALAQARARHLHAPVPTLPPGWRSNRSQPHVAAYDIGGERLEVRYARERSGTWRCSVGEQTWQVRVLGWPDGETGTLDLEVDDRRLRATVTVSDATIDVDSALGHSPLRPVLRFPKQETGQTTGSLLAPMPGSVVAVEAAAGDVVEAGDLIVVLEAMKMEHRVTAPHAGTVIAVHVAAGDPVNHNDVLAVVDPREDVEGQG